MLHETRFESDVFISYSHSDIEWVTGYLIPMLRSWSLKIWWDHSELLPGQRLAGTLCESIRSARHVLFVCSKSFIESEWCRDELETVRAEDPASLRHKAIPVVLDDKAVPNLLLDTVWCNLSDETQIDENEWKKLCKSVGGSWSDESQRILNELQDIRKFFGTILDSNLRTNIVVRSHRTHDVRGLDYVISKGSALAVSYVYALLAKINKLKRVHLLTSDDFVKEPDFQTSIMPDDCIFIGGTNAAIHTVSTLSPDLFKYQETSTGYKYVIEGTQYIEFGHRVLSFCIYKSKTVPKHTVLWLFSPFADGCVIAARYFHENYWNFVRQRQDKEFLEVYRLIGEECRCVYRTLP